MPAYSRTELVQLLEMAKSLGFWDDAAHWQSELDKYDSR